MRTTLKCGVIAAAISGAALCAGSVLAADAIKIGVLEDQSGDFALATIGKVHGIQLATDEINKAGGIAGRPIRARRSTTLSLIIRVTRNSCAA